MYLIYINVFLVKYFFSHQEGDGLVSLLVRYLLEGWHYPLRKQQHFRIPSDLCKEQGTSIVSVNKKYPRFMKVKFE